MQLQNFFYNDGQDIKKGRRPRTTDETEESPKASRNPRSSQVTPTAPAFPL